MSSALTSRARSTRRTAAPTAAVTSWRWGSVQSILTVRSIDRLPLSGHGIMEDPAADQREAPARQRATARSMSAGSGARSSVYSPVAGCTKPSTAAWSIGRGSVGSTGATP